MAANDRVSPGQPFSESPLVHASVINDMLEMLDAYKRNRMGQRGGVQSSNGPRLQVKNNSGANLLRGNVLQITARATGEHDPLAPWFDASTPSSDLDQRIAILTDAILDGKIGEAVVVGHCCAMVNVTDTGHKFATAQSGSNILKSADKGPIQILDLPEETGEQELWVNVLGAASFDPPTRTCGDPVFDPE